MSVEITFEQNRELKKFLRELLLDKGEEESVVDVIYTLSEKIDEITEKSPEDILSEYECPNCNGELFFICKDRITSFKYNIGCKDCDFKLNKNNNYANEYSALNILKRKYDEGDSIGL